MNIHHLELFYYVAKHGGIMGAVRKMPYGIQQPAVSGQIIQLEDDLGVKLFQRRPFALTPPGEKLYESIQPFFDRIDAVCDQIREGKSELIRLGAPTMVLDRYFPEIVRELHQALPSVKLALREGHNQRVQQWLEAGEIDMAITPIDGPNLDGFEKEPLINIQVCLLVPKSSKIDSAEFFWSQDRITDPLISLPPTELVAKRFHSYLEQNHITWPPQLELSSLDLIERYVASGLGIGMGIQKLSADPSDRVRRLPINGIDDIKVGALWRHQLTTAGERVLELCQSKAEALKKLTSS